MLHILFSHLNDNETIRLTDAVQSVQSALTDPFLPLPPAAAVDASAHQKVGQDVTAGPKKCHSCSDRIEFAKKCFDKKENIMRAFSSLVKVFSCLHLKQNMRNVDLENSAMSLLLENLTVKRINQMSESSGRQSGTFVIVHVCIIEAIYTSKNVQVELGLSL